MAASIFKSHRRRAVRHRKSVRSVRRSTEHVYFLRSHRQPIDVERGLDANGVDGRSAVASTGGVPDPLGGNDAMQLTNTAQTTQQIIQNTSGPSAFVYCYSVYVRAVRTCTIQLVVTATGQTALTAVNTGASWTRVTASGSLSVQQDGVGFGVQLPAGAQVEAFGAQVEAQPEAGLYKKNIDLGGVYTSTRFSSDLLSFTATAPNQNSCQLDLISSLKLTR